MSSIMTEVVNEIVNSRRGNGIRGSIKNSFGEVVKGEVARSVYRGVRGRMRKVDFDFIWDSRVTGVWDNLRNRVEVGIRDREIVNKKSILASLKC